MDFEGFGYGYDFDSPDGPRTRMRPSLPLRLIGLGPALPACGLQPGARILIGSPRFMILLLTQSL